MKTYDVIVIGGGIAGVSIGYELAANCTVGLLEMEASLAFHTTGRSVATFLESYGGRVIRQLTTASRSFMENPPDGFTRPLLTPLPLVWVAPHGEADDLRAMQASVSEFVTMQELAPDEVQQRVGVFREDWVELGLLEPGASEIDVAALHGGFTAGLRQRGGEIHTSAGVVSMHRDAGLWQVVDRNGNQFSAPVVVNAAGAWADQIALLAGAEPVGIRPLRRTVFTFVPNNIDPHDLPLVADVGGNFYFKPEGSQVLVSPADEVPSVPCDARVEEIDIAQAIEIINDATTFDVRHVRSSWAGLRSFVADRTPVSGFDDCIEGFFWFVGQGGYGIQISPALAQAGASLIHCGDLPQHLLERGLDAACLGRERLVGLPDLELH